MNRESPSTEPSAGQQALLPAVETLLELGDDEGDRASSLLHQRGTAVCTLATTLTGACGSTGTEEDQDVKLEPEDTGESRPMVYTGPGVWCTGEAATAWASRGDDFSGLPLLMSPAAAALH